MVETMEMEHKPETTCVSLIRDLVLDDGTCHPDVEKKKKVKDDISLYAMCH